VHIGLVGGIGVAATQVYYQRLTDAVDGHFDLTIVHANAAELVADNRANRRAAQAQAYLPLLERLARAGADCAAITSLGGHFCFDETAALSPLPLVSGVTPLDTYFAENGLRCVGLLGTSVVMRTHLYGQLTHTAAVAPDDPDRIGAQYTDMALAGHASDAARALFLAEGAALMDKGADAVVLAGTDLGLVFDGVDPGYPVIDALDVHVAYLARLVRGQDKLIA